MTTYLKEETHISQCSHSIEKQNSYGTITNISPPKRKKRKNLTTSFPKFFAYRKVSSYFRNQQGTFLFFWSKKSYLHFSKKSVSVDTHYPSKPVENGNGVPRWANKLMEAWLQKKGLEKGRTHPLALFLYRNRRKVRFIFS